MAIADLIPSMDDAGLANLRNNALRLKESNDGRQQEQAELLLPLIEAELAERLAKKPPKKTPVRKKAAPAAVPAAADASKAE